MLKQNQSTRIRSAVLAAAIGAALVTPRVVNAALETRTWIGETSERWNEHANWLPASAPLSSDRIAVFDALATYQPAISTHVTVIAGIWMTGDTVGDVEITSDPTGQNNGAPTFQTNGNTINGVDNVGILLNNTSSGGLTINTSAFKVGGDQSWINNSANLFTLASPTNLNGKIVTITGSGNTLISGNLTNSTGTGRLTKTGSGTLTLSAGTISYNGETTVADGALLVNGTMSSSNAVVTVTGGTLGGTGTIGRATTINAGATLAPGVSADAAGVLTINRNLTLAGTTAFDLADSASHDVVRINALNENGRTLTFGGTLVVAASPEMDFTAGQTFDLLDWGANTTVSGTFDAVQLPSLGDGLSWQMFGDQPFDYATGEIAVVPEPAGLTLLAPAVVLIGRRRRSIRA